MARTGSLFLQLTNTPSYFEGRDGDLAQTNPYPASGVDAKAWSLGRAHRRERDAQVQAKQAAARPWPQLGPGAQ